MAMELIAQVVSNHGQAFPENIYFGLCVLHVETRPSEPVRRPCFVRFYDSVDV